MVGTVYLGGGCIDRHQIVDGDTWTFTGDQERATHTFTESGTRQDIHWEHNVDGTWLPLCDRVAHRVELSSSRWGSHPDRP